MSLFGQRTWSEVEQTRRDRLRAEISNLNSTSVLQSSVEDLCEYYEETYFVDVPELLKDGIVVDQQEREIDVGRRREDYTPGPQWVKGTEVSVTIPFVGDSSLFTIRPSTFTPNPPDADVEVDRLIIRIAGTALNGQSVRAQIDGAISAIESYLANLRSDAAIFNRGLRAYARQHIEARRQKLLADQKLVSELGFPLKVRDGGPSPYTAPQVKRRFKPSPPPHSSQPFRPEPALAMGDYEQILNVLQDLNLVMERSPSAFRTINEEALRSHCLVQLNGYYEGQTLVEAFTYLARTDILITVEGRPIFIGECRFWEGSSSLTATLDQLLNYSAWRNTKVALIVVNRRKILSNVLLEIASTIEKHPNHKRTLPVFGDSRVRCVFSHRDEPAREMIVTVLAFNVPGQPK